MASLLLAAVSGLSSQAEATEFCDNVMVGQTGGGNGTAPTPIFQRQCSSVAGAVAFDVSTRGFSSAWSDPDPGHALRAAVSQCGGHCIAQSFWSDYFYVAIADNDRAWGFSERSDKEAVQQCQNNGGQGCVVVLVGSSTGPASYFGFSALAYDASTGAQGKAVELARERDAKAAAIQQCGTPACWAYAFQGSGSAAIARSKDGQLVAAWVASEGLLSNPSRKAKSACKKQTGDGDCEVVATLTSKERAVETRKQTDQLLDEVQRFMDSSPANPNRKTQ
ncbi:DUF4189 domain-containing protein [Pseudoxanthomonas sp. GM95]|uniref:DUF4189 domain-containing protein n=1 Tax=Pseudoxanthomonas sp. GM95 TaxID=1881043 RepID=UPI0015872E01|nr:DUF4189 domain-containing protein [Pseudoxanthomonas sp. GM95]